MIARLFIRASGWLRSLFTRRPRLYRLLVVDGDELPDELPPRTVVVAREDGVDWIGGLACPCGCGRRIQLMLLPDVKPRWTVHVGTDGAPSLHPSVWAREGCRSHFWLRHGQIEWCNDD